MKIERIISNHLSIQEDTRPKILLSMGLGMRGREGWTKQIHDLQNTFDLYTFDHPGLGDSIEERPYSSTQMRATHLLEQMKSLGVYRFHLVGVSFGGMIAQKMWEIAPEQIQSLTLIATHAGGLLRIFPKFKLLLEIVRALLFETGPSSIPQATIYTKSFRLGTARADLKRRWQMATQPKCPFLEFAQILAILGHQFKRPEKTSGEQVQLISPKEDLLSAPRHMRELYKKIPGSLFYEISPSGHGVVYEKGEVVSQLIRDHVLQHHK